MNRSCRVRSVFSGRSRRTVMGAIPLLRYSCSWRRKKPKCPAPNHGLRVEPHNQVPPTHRETPSLAAGWRCIPVNHRGRPKKFTIKHAVVWNACVGLTVGTISENGLNPTGAGGRVIRLGVGRPPRPGGSGLVPPGCHCRPRVGCSRGRKRKCVRAPIPSGSPEGPARLPLVVARGPG